MTKAEAQRWVNKFNEQFPVGTKLEWRSLASERQPYVKVTVSAPAFITGVGKFCTPVAYFLERSGYCSVSPDFAKYD
jgi:hypothetical protein